MADHKQLNGEELGNKVGSRGWTKILGDKIRVIYSDDRKKWVNERWNHIQDATKKKNPLALMETVSYSMAETVKRIDDDLKENNSPFEVSYFRVSGNATLVGGMTVDVHYTKTATAKEEDQYLVVINPSTDTPIKIPKKGCIGQDTIKARDPHTGEVLKIDVKTMKVIDFDEDQFLKVINPRTGTPIKIPRKSCIGLDTVQIKDP